MSTRRRRHRCHGREPRSTLRLGHPPQRAGHHPGRPGWPTGCAPSATRVELVEIVTDRRHLDRAAGHDRRHRRLRRRAAPGPARRRGRPRRALAQGPADRARARPGRRRDPGARGPARRARRPRRPAPSASCRPAAVVGTGSPRRAAQLAALGLGLRGRGRPRQRRHPASRLVSDGALDARRPGPRRPGPARPPRRGHRGRSTRSRCCRPRARARWPSSAAPTTRRRRRRRRAPSTTPTPAPASPPSGRCSPPSRPAAPRRSAPWPRSSRARTASSCRCARSSAAVDGVVRPAPLPRRAGRRRRALGRELAAVLLADGADLLRGPEAPACRTGPPATIREPPADGAAARPSRRDRSRSARRPTAARPHPDHDSTERAT